MVQNSLSPAFVKISYVWNAHDHVMTLPVIPVGTPVPGVEPEVVLNGGGTIAYSDAIDDFIAVVKAQFHADTTFAVADFWSQPTPASDPIWIHSHNLGVVGTHASVAVAMSQRTYTWRTSEGGIMKSTLLEIPGTLNVRGSPPYAGANGTFATFFLGNSCCVVGRDGGSPLAAVHYYNKTNDALRKRFILNE